MRREEGIKPFARPRQPFGRLFPPGLVPERGDRDVNGNPGDGPRTQPVFHPFHNVRFRDQETQAQPGQPVGLAERPQHDQPGLWNRRYDAEPGLGKLGKGLVDDQPPPRERPAVLQVPERLRLQPAPVGIVGIAEDRDFALLQHSRVVAFDHGGAGGLPGSRKLSISGRTDRYPAGRKDTGQRGNQDLRAGRDGDQIRIARAIGRRGGLLELPDMYGLRQARIGCFRNRPYGIGKRVDARRKIDQRFRRIGISSPQQR